MTTAQSRRAPQPRRKPVHLPAIPRNQQEDEEDASFALGRTQSSLSTQDALSPSAAHRRDTVLNPRNAVFADIAGSQLRQHVDLSGWPAPAVDAALRLLLHFQCTGDRESAAALQQLTLDGCERITSLECLTSSDSGGRIGAFLQLTSLRLERCQSLSPESVSHFPLTLTDLSLAHCEWVSDQCLRALVRRCRALASVSLRHCRCVTDYGVAAFADASEAKSTLSTLTTLDISYCTKVTDMGVLAVVTRASRLRVLLAAGLPLLEGGAIQGLTRTPTSSLETLDVSDCAHLSAAGMSHLVRAYANTRLTDLNASSCAQLSDDVLVALGRYSPRLRTLRLASCPLVSDAGVQRLVEFVPPLSADAADSLEHEQVSSAARCVQLRTLELSGCFQLTDAALVAVGRQCADLEVLLVDGVRRLTDAGVRVITHQCARLRTIRWSGTLVRSRTSAFFSVPRLDRAALSAVSAAAQLTTLHVGNTTCDTDAFCALLTSIGRQLRDVDVTVIATDAICESIGAWCAQLRSLRLSRSRYFSEANFATIARGCRQLRSLDLESCEQIRDASVEAISAHCVHLERLVLANDWQVTDRAVLILGEQCPQLLVLNVRHCPEVTLSALQLLASQNTCVVATRDGLSPKHANVVQCVRENRRVRIAATRITRWLAQRLHARDDVTLTLEAALRSFRRRKRAAVRIQRCVRRFQQLKHQRTLIAQATREREQRVATAWRTVRDLCVASRELRAFLRRWRATRRLRELEAAERVRALREQAAVAIERVVRGFLGRQRAHITRQAVLIDAQRRAHAATTIQRIVRGHASRATLVALARRERENVVFRVVWRLEQRERAALWLQCAARGFVGRRRSRARATELERLRGLRQRSATRVQRCYRAHLARVQLGRFLFRTATQLQRVFRGHHGRQLARAIVLERSYALAPRILILLPRSIFTRSLAAQWKRKRDAAALVASNLQRLYRGYVGRVRFRVVRALARQAWFTADMSARALQHFFRSIVCVSRRVWLSHLCPLLTDTVVVVVHLSVLRILQRLARFQAHLRLRHRSAITIQAMWRMWTAKVLALAHTLQADRRRRHEALLALLLADGADSRDMRVKRHFLLLGAAWTIAAAYRASLLARGWLSPSQLRVLNASATRIQAAARGHLSRRYVRWFRETLVTATQLVQRVWRGKAGRKIWRQLVTERAQRLREQEEDDRAARVARKLSSQYALDAYERDARHARVLQDWYRTLRNRQVFKQAREQRTAALETCAAEKLARVLKLSTASVVFQSRVWRDCMEQKDVLLAMEEDACVALEKEVAELKTACRVAHVAGAQAAVEHSVSAARKSGFVRAKKRAANATEQVKARVKPFAVQAKKLTKLSARVHVTNKQLQHELRTVDKGVRAFHRHLHHVLLYEPLLLQSDVADLVSLLELPDGRSSIVADELTAEALPAPS